MVSKNGLNKWSQQMVSNSSPRNDVKKWLQLVVSKHGLNKWSQKEQHMVSRNRWKLTHDGPEISSEATPSRSKIEPESTRDRPEATWAPPGGPQAEKARKCYFWRKRESQGDPFWNRFCIVSLYETNKTRVWRYRDNTSAREKVAFSNGRYWKYSEKVSTPWEWRNKAIGNLLVQN